MDKFWINMWIFFLIVTVLTCFMMAGLFGLNNAAQNSEEASIEEKEAIKGITYALWDDAKVLVPTGLFILLVTLIIYRKYGNHNELHTKSKEELKND